MFPILNPPPFSFPVPSLWVFPVHQPQASSIVHQTWTGDLFHIWCYTCSTLAWKLPWTEDPGRLQSMGSLRVRHDWVPLLSLFTSCIGEGNGNPLQCSCLENPRDGGAWWAAISGVTQSQTRLKQLSSSSSILLSENVNCGSGSVKTFTTLRYSFDLV